MYFVSAHVQTTTEYQQYIHVHSNMEIINEYFTKGLFVLALIQVIIIYFIITHYRCIRFDDNKIVSGAYDG